MTDQLHAQISEEILRIFGVRKGDPPPLDRLHECQAMLRLASEHLDLTADCRPEDREQALRSLLGSVVHASGRVKVQVAGDLLGLTELSDEELRRLVNRPGSGLRRGAVDTGIASKEVRLVIAGSRLQPPVGSRTVRARQKEFAVALATALLAYVADGQGELPAHGAPAPPQLPPATAGSGTSPLMKRKRWPLPVAVVAAIAVGVTLVVALDQAGVPQGQTPITTTPGGQSSVPAAPSAGRTDAVLNVSTTWPTLRGCDSVTSVAMAEDGPDITSFDSSADPRAEIIASPGGASWREGYLYLSLSSSSSEAIQIFNMVPDVNRAQPLPAPAWIYYPEGGCGDSQFRLFDLDLDSGSIVDRQVVGSAAVEGQPPPPQEPLGSAFTVTDTDQAVVAVRAFGCGGNYEWRLKLEYIVGGEQKQLELGPFRSMASGVNVPAYTHRVDDNGKSVLVEARPFSGGCANEG